MADSEHNERRGADIEVGATVRMKNLRVEEKSGVETSTDGGPSSETETIDERENLPAEIKLGETYRNAWIRKHIAIRLNDPGLTDD